MCVFQLPCLFDGSFPYNFRSLFLFLFSLLRNVFLRLRFFEVKKLYSKFSLDCKRNLFYIRIINIQNINSYFFWAQHYQINLPNRWWPNTLESIFFENFRHFLLICFFFSVVSSDNLVANIFIFLMFFILFIQVKAFTWRLLGETIFYKYLREIDYTRYSLNPNVTPLLGFFLLQPTWHGLIYQNIDEICWKS